MNKSIKFAVFLLLGFISLLIASSTQTYAMPRVLMTPTAFLPKPVPFQVRSELICEPDCASLYAKVADGGQASFIVKLKASFVREADLPDAKAIDAQRKAITAAQDQFATQYLTKASRQFNIWPYGLTPYAVVFGGLEEVTFLMKNPAVVGLFEDSPSSTTFDLGLSFVKPENPNAPLVPDTPLQCKPSCTELLEKTDQGEIRVSIKLRTEKAIIAPDQLKDKEAERQQKVMIRRAQGETVAKFKTLPGVFGTEISSIGVVNAEATLLLGANKQRLEYLLIWHGIWSIEQQTLKRAS